MPRVGQLVCSGLVRSIHGGTAACSAAKRWAPLNGERTSTFLPAYQNRLVGQTNFRNRKGFFDAVSARQQSSVSLVASLLSFVLPHPRSGEVLGRTLERGNREGGGEKKKKTKMMVVSSFFVAALGCSDESHGEEGEIGCQLRRPPRRRQEEEEERSTPYTLPPPLFPPRLPLPLPRLHLKHPLISD